jgi:hypothetical protein
MNYTGVDFMYEKKLNDPVGILISGENLSIEKFGIRYLIRILSSLEKTISSLVRKENPHLEKDFKLSLVDIENGSVSLAFSVPKYHGALHSAYKLFVDSISTGYYDKLTDEAVKELSNLVDFTTETGFTISFPMFFGEGEAIKITPETQVDIPKPHYIMGEAEIYAKIERVGGIKKPKVTIRLLEDKTIDCDIDDIELAKRLAHRLYDWVGLVGDARWNIKDYSITEFKIADITEYKEMPLSETMENLSDNLADDYKDVKDVIGYIKQIRRGDKV